MAWTPPVDWSTIAIPDEDDFNEQIKGNLEFLYDPPSCYAYRNTNVAISTGTGDTDIQLNAELWDNNGMHLTSGGTQQDITVVTAGRYLHLGGWLMEANATGRRTIKITYDEGGQAPAKRFPGLSASASFGMQIAGLKNRAATNTSTLTAQQNSGGNLNLLAFTPFLMLHWVGNP
jgi:hypothetical protein